MLAITEHQVYLFFLLMVRATAMFAIAPVFSNKGLPKTLKIGLGGLMALLLLPAVDAHGNDLAFNNISGVILVFQEMMTGLMIGFTLAILFAGIAFAGEYVSLDMGFSMAQMFDPTFNQTMSVITRLQNIAATLIFLIIDGHHFLIQAVAYSYEVLPIGGWNLSMLALDRLLRLSAQMFVIGIKVAAPAIVALFLTSVAMGIIARAVPQMNIFFVGFPLRISAGLVFLGFGLPLFVYVFRMLLMQFEKDILYILQVL